MIITKKVYFSDGTEFEGDTDLDNGGVWTIEDDVWRWYPGWRISMITRHER